VWRCLPIAERLDVICSLWRLIHVGQILCVPIIFDKCLNKLSGSLRMHSPAATMRFVAVTCGALIGPLRLHKSQLGAELRGPGVWQGDSVQASCVYVQWNAIVFHVDAPLLRTSLATHPATSCSHRCRKPTTELTTMHTTVLTSQPCCNPCCNRTPETGSATLPTTVTCDRCNRVSTPVNLFFVRPTLRN
jgi:hypothetical protein